MNAISLINKVSANKLAIVLGRILAKLHTTDEKAFTTDEEEKLCTMFKLEMSELNNVMNSSAFIFDTCAQHSLKPNRLCFELKNCGMDEKQVSAFEKAWIDHGPQFIERLKETCFAPKTLKDINWSLQMSVASQNSSQLRQPRAIFELKTGDPLQPKKVSDKILYIVLINFHIYMWTTHRFYCTIVVLTNE